MQPITAPGGGGSAVAGRERGFLRRHRHAVSALVGAAAIAGVIQFVLPQLSALGPTLHRLKGTDPRWIGAGVVLEGLSLGGHIALFRTVFSGHGARTTNSGARTRPRNPSAGTAVSR